MFNVEEIKAWEEEQMEKVHERYEPSKKRRAFNPHKDRMFKARRYFTMKYGGYVESYSNKRKWKKHIRAKYRLIRDDAHHPQKKEYHTYGWLTW
jgi:hypothetical protein